MAAPSDEEIPGPTRISQTPNQTVEDVAGCPMSPPDHTATKKPDLDKNGTDLSGSPEPESPSPMFSDGQCV